MEQERATQPRWRVRIPEIHYTAFALLLDLPEPSFQSLVEALASAQPVQDQEALIQQIDEKVPIRTQDLEEIVAMSISLQLLRIDTQASLPEFVWGIADALDRVQSEDLGPAADKRDNAEERLTALLKIEGALGVLAKAQDLRIQHEHTLLSSRIFTDLRPLFSDDPTVHPIAAIIAHTLKLAYYEGQEQRELFVALRASDVRKLRKILERAEQKAASIEDKFAESTYIVREELA